MEKFLTQKFDMFWKINRNKDDVKKYFWKAKKIKNDMQLHIWRISDILAMLNIFQVKY